MDPRTVLSAFDEQVRRNPDGAAPDCTVERDEHVVRCLGGPGGWSGVTWCDLDESSADAAIAEQVERFAGLTHSWEWKHYSHDRPDNLPERLLGAGFVAEPSESLLVAEIAALDLEAPPPSGVRLVPVLDAAGADALVLVHGEVFGGDHASIRRALAVAVRVEPSRPVAAVVAWAGPTPIAAGRVEFHRGTDFASLWGGGTVPAWRGRGVFRALVAHRARQAAARGFRYLQVDAVAASRPILLRMGFAELATTTPFIHRVGTS